MRLWLALMLLAGACPASGGDWFAALNVSAGRAEVLNFDLDGRIGTGALINGIVDGSLDEHGKMDVVAGIGGSLGRRWPGFVVELEYLWRYRTDWDLTAITPSLGTVINIFADVETHSLLLNAAWRRAFGRRWELLLGGGAGMASNDLATKYKQRVIPGVSPVLVFPARDQSRDPAWNLYAGLGYQLLQDFQFNVRYRYAALGQMAAGPFNGREVRVRGDHVTQELLLSLTYTF